MVDIPDIPQAEAAIIAQTNAFRRSQNLSHLKPNAELTRAAQAFAEHLARTSKFAHEADGRQPSERTKAAGYKHCTVAENLAKHLDGGGFTASRLATLAMEGWKASPGHHANLVRREVTEIGVGIARAPMAIPNYVTVQLFGRPESLRRSITIENRSSDAVTYTAMGQSGAVPARARVALSACDDGDVTISHRSGWFSRRQVIGTFKSRDGAVYTVTGAPGGVRVTVEADQ